MTFRFLRVLTSLVLAVGTLPARAAVLVDIEEAGPNVVAVASGTIDTNALTHYFDFVTTTAIAANEAGIFFGPNVVNSSRFYFGVIGPAHFGSGLTNFTSSHSGNVFGLVPGTLFLSPAYASGDPLSAIDTFDNATFTSLGLVPGTYGFSFGSGVHVDTVTVHIGAVPEPATWTMMILGFLGLGFVTYRRKSKPAMFLD